MGASRHCRDLGGMVRKIFARRHTGLLMEHGAKILCGVEPDHTGHLVDTETAGFQQRFGFFDFYTVINAVIFSPVSSLNRCRR